MKFDEFMDEVQNDILHDRMERYWKNYGKYAIGFVCAVLSVVVFYTLHKNRTESLSLQTSEKVIAAQNAIVQGKFDDAATFLDDVINTAPDTYRTLALFNKVGLILKSGKNKADAINILKLIESSSFADADFRILAQLLRYSHELNEKDIKTEEFDTMRLNVDKLAKEDTAWSFLAREVKGLILYKVGANSEAAEVFINLVQDPKTPQAIKLRSQLMAQSLSVKITK